MIQPVQKRLLKTSEAAAYLRCSPWKIRSLVHNQELPHIAIDEDDGVWRFDVTDLDKFIESRRTLGA